MNRFPTANLAAVLLLGFVFAPCPAKAYEVWMGTHLMRSADANDLPAWSLTASQLDGININRAPNDTDPASNNDWRTIFAQFTNAGHKMSEIARSEVTRNPVQVDDLAEDEIDQRLSEIFGFENTFGYDLDILMFYNERGTYQGVEYLYEWTEIEVQHMRDWLDENGHADVQLMWNVRNNSVDNQNWAKNSLVDLVEIEASTTAFLANTNNQRTFFDWFWTNPATANKRIALQFPRVLPGDPLNQYQGTRRVAQSLGGTIGYGEDGMRSDRLIFLPVTYNDDYDYLPETVSSGTAYTNTLTSIALSLIEQRDFFEGRLATLPTVADADSVARLFPPTITDIADQVVSENTPTGAIAFTIDDFDTAVGSLTVSGTSSNTTLVPNSGIVFSGTGANRTITVTPAAGQMGMSDIAVEVSDGLLIASKTFTLTVGGVMFSEASDAGVKEDPLVVDQASSTTQLGAGGNSPWVDRCTVYVFELPDLGAVSNPFTSSSFTFNYEAKDGTLKNNDLYGLGRRDSATVLSSDYYGQTATGDPTDATPLQTSILTDSTPLGVVGTSSGGNTALANYLNAQYASGAGIGKYVFLRLNTAQSKSGINRATLTMSEGGVANPTDTRPRIIYTGNSSPTISTVNDFTTNVGTATGAIPFTIGDVETAAGSLIVTATSSNTTLIPNANIVLGGSGANRTVNITPEAVQTGMAVITIQVSDGTRIVTMNFTLSVLRTLFADFADSAPRQADGSGPSILASTATDASLYAGRAGTGSTVDRCVVFPFQLPDFGSTTTPFTSATFSFDLVSNDFSPLTCNLDLYGLGIRDTPMVLASDFYSETDVPDPTAGTTRLRDNLCTAATAAGLITSSTGSSALVDYLNAQYAGGANAGRYVFLRLSKDTANGTNTRRYVVTSTDGADAVANSAIWPRINYSSLAVPTVIMVALGSPVNLTDGSTWSDGLPAHPGVGYIIPATGNLRSETGTSTFPGSSLTIQAGGKFQVRAMEGSGEETTVNYLILSGGTSHASGECSELAAGTGNSVTNVLDGVITNSGHTRFLTYGTVGGSTIARSLRVLSRIDGSGRIQIYEGSAEGLSSVFIDNAGNSFAGDWEVAPGSTLVFGNGGAVGSADIEVLGGATLRILGNWTTGASLIVADGAGTEVDLGNHGWTVSSLVLGGANVPSGTYDVAALNSLGAHSVFAGSGTLTVALSGADGPVARWALDEGTGSVASDSSGNGHAGNLLNGATWSSDATRQSFVVFDGTDDRIATPFTYALSSSDDFTWAWWANRTAAGSSGAVMVGNRYPEGSPDELYEFIKFTPVEAQFANVESAASIDKYNYADLPQDGWHHYAMVKTGTGFQWYVDGVPQGSPVTRDYSEDSEIPFQIGGDDDGSGTKVNEHFEGAIDDVVLYDRALGAVELAYVKDGAYSDLPVTYLEDWRLLHFGTTENTGTAADTFDANGDGEDNLLEFATGQNPHAATLLATPIGVNGDTIEFRYTRSKAAVADGVTFQVEWSDTLQPGSWSSTGVSEQILTDDGTLQDIKATLPAGTGGSRFLHFKVTEP